MSKPNRDTNGGTFLLDPNQLADRVAVLAAVSGGARFGRVSPLDARLLASLINRRHD
ncbi:hypothetical protein OHB12_33700 [Nocardia sp. NBC_01730]|uniref:hypothetical protein n=1 Tax=Nocardia sp. NBC_01730 TaxID=2975998 RepID=UPI002E0EE596|nr:hypothetical protein OHB12_33700 [Nocardia sp. NBC_01730]